MLLKTMPRIRPFSGVPNTEVKWKYEAFFPSAPGSYATRFEYDNIFGYGNDPISAIDDMWLQIEIITSDIHK